MGRHNKQKPAIKTVGIFSIGSLAFGAGAAAVFPTIAASATESPCDGQVWIPLPDSNVCELAPGLALPWIIEGGQGAEFSIPAGASKLAVILIGDGATFLNEDKTPAPQGGEVIYYETNNPSGSYRVGFFGSTIRLTKGQEVVASARHASEVPTYSGFTGSPQSVSGWIELATLDQTIWTPLGYNAGFGYAFNFNWLLEPVSGTGEVYQIYGTAYNLAAGSGTGGYASVRILIGPTESTPPAPSAVDYQGPIGLATQTRNLCSNSNAVATGQRLSTIAGVEVNGKPVSFELLPNGNISYSLKDVPAGTYQVKYWVPVNGVYLTETIKVGSCSAPSANGNFTANRLFSNYQGDRGVVQSGDLAAITAFITKYQGIKSVTCIGSTSGVPARRGDTLLAQARAKSACDVVKGLVPDASVTLKTSVGKGVGQKYRSVQIFISGSN